MSNKRLLTVLTFFLLSITFSAIADSIPKGTYTLKTANGAVWDLTLDGSGKFKATEDGSDVVLGKYKVTKDQIQFTDEEGVYAEKGDAKTRSYKWKVTDNKLMFTNIDDKADGRSSTLTAGPWEMKK